MANRAWVHDLIRDYMPWTYRKLYETVAGSADQGRDPGPGYRKITNETRDLPEFTRQREIKVAYWLWRTNPLARRIVEINTDFVVGDGFKVQAPDPYVQALLDEHWNDPVNDWAGKLHARVRDLSLFGELILTVYVNPVSGRVKLGYVDPASVSEVVSSPWNVERVTAIRVTETSGKDAWLRVIYEEDTPDDLRRSRLTIADADERSPAGTPYAASCFYWRINHVTNSQHGSSDLAPVADWIDAHDTFLFNALERSALMNAFVFDVTLKGANPQMIARRKQEIRDDPPRPGRVQVHNENETWTAVVPSFGAGEHDTMNQMIRKLVVAGAGIAETWLGTGEDANRASALAMGTPIFRRLKARQALVVNMASQVCRLVVEQAAIRAAIPPAEDGSQRDLSFTVVAPPIVPEDEVLAAQGFSTVTAAADAALTSGYITREEADAMVRRAGRDLGLPERRSEENGVEAPKAPEITEGQIAVLAKAIGADPAVVRAAVKPKEAVDPTLAHLYLLAKRG